MEHDEIKEIAMNFGHELCLGIRAGLYGSNASDNSNDIANGLFEIAGALNNVAEAIYALENKK